MKREFVFIAEAGLLAQQALLLAESLRAFGGRYAADAITILQPRAERPIAAGQRAQLEALGARMVEMAITSPCPEYGTSYRVLACAEYERHCPADCLIFLDSDMVVLAEPDLELAGADVCARPVDVKGIGTAGEGDPHDGYWRELCRVCAVEYDQLPEVISTVDGARLKAFYNGGLVVTNPAHGLFARTATFFLASLRAGLVPSPGEQEAFAAGHGVVSAEGRRLWGSAQACLSLAIAALGLRVRMLPASQNFPLHSYPQLRERIERGEFPPVALVHYHHVLRNHSRDNPLLAGGPLFPAASIEWLCERADRFTWKADQRLILVLGMHRTGSSMLTKGLETLGVDLGSDFHPATPDNPSGFWEDRGFHGLNEALLAALGSSWDDLRVLEPERVRQLCEGEFRARALMLIHDCLSRGALVGVKDPRFAVLLPFWEKAFSDAGVPVSYVVSVRNPLSVAASLEQRDAIPKQKALWLWALHYLGIFAATAAAPAPPVIIDYDRLMDDPAGELERLAASLGLAVNPEMLAAYAAAFLKPELRHTRFQPADLAADAECDGLICEINEALQEQASAGALADSRAPWAERVCRWKTQLAELAPVLAAVAEQARIGEPFRVQIVALRERLRALEAERAIIPAQAARIAQLEEEAGIIPWQAEQIAALQQRIGTLEARSAKMGGRATQAAARVAELRQRFAELHASPYWKLTKPVRSLFKRLPGHPASEPAPAPKPGVSPAPTPALEVPAEPEKIRLPANWREIPGWFQWPSAQEEAVRHFPAGSRFVEVGNYLGRSLCSLAEIATASGKPFKIIGVDTCRGSGIEGARKKDYHGAAVAEGGGTFAGLLHRNVIQCGFGEMVSLIVSDSHTAADFFPDGSLEWVHLDARHEYEPVKMDIQAWLPKVKRGGWISGDDYDPEKWAGVVQAVRETLPGAQAWSNQQWRWIVQ